MEFETFNIDAIEMKDWKRVACPRCQSKHLLFCPYCCIALDHIPPQIMLPIQVDIYRHPHEKPQRSTTVDCKIISPQSVTIFNETIDESILDRYTNKSRVLILYPSEDSQTVDRLDVRDFDKLVVIDGTWSQAKGMARRASTLGFVPVRIQSHTTLFWRYQSLDRTYLSTIEAIYWFFVEYDIVVNNLSAISNAIERMNEYRYDQKYDNLLYYFKIKYNMIQEYYKANRKKTFTPRHAIADSYIHYE
jgi:DTW domain-containing protein YfiP